MKLGSIELMESNCSSPGGGDCDDRDGPQHGLGGAGGDLAGRAR